MLNPSTADAERDDPTVRRCIGYARSWGYGALTAVNLFAYRCTDPRDLRRVEDPVGPENDRHLLAVRERFPVLIAAWGNWGRLHGRRDSVMCLLSSESSLYCLGVTRSGYPLHPLHQRGDLAPIPYPPAGLSLKENLPTVPPPPPGP
jgi:hypothetical protein